MEKELFGHAIHLDIDKSKGIFIRSLQVDTFLNNIPTKELIGLDTKPTCNANFFGKLPEDDKESDILQGLHQG